MQEVRGKRRTRVETKHKLKKTNRGGKTGEEEEEEDNSETPNGSRLYDPTQRNSQKTAERQGSSRGRIWRLQQVCLTGFQQATAASLPSPAGPSVSHGLTTTRGPLLPRLTSRVLLPHVDLNWVSLFLYLSLLYCLLPPLLIPEIFRPVLLLPVATVFL